MLAGLAGARFGLNAKHFPGGVSGGRRAAVLFLELEFRSLGIECHKR